MVLVCYDFVLDLKLWVNSFDPGLTLVLDFNFMHDGLMVLS